MVAEYQLCLPDKALLQKKLHEIQESLSESEDENNLNDAENLHSK
jgi:hypothetical protein